MMQGSLPAGAAVLSRIVIEPAAVAVRDEMSLGAPAALQVHEPTFCFPSPLRARLERSTDAPASARIVVAADACPV